MLDRRISKDEYLEKLWEMQESGRTTVDELRKAMGSDFETGMIEDLDDEGLALLDHAGGAIALTDTGWERARHIIRAHRIGERLVRVVFRFRPDRSAISARTPYCSWRSSCR